MFGVPDAALAVEDERSFERARDRDLHERVRARRRRPLRGEQRDVQARVLRRLQTLYPNREGQAHYYQGEQC